MSTVKVTNIQNASASAVNAVTTSGGDLTNAAGVSFMGGNKNLLFNGGMQVAQRGTSTASITTAGYYTADRWYQAIASLGTWTQSVENDAPTGSGLRKSLKVLCTSADAAPAAGDSFIMQQIIEGQDVQRIAKGTSSAQQLTLSFWVKSSTTGTYVAEIVDNDNTRAVSAAYTISASATWEKKTITFPADTTGAFDNDNAASLYADFWLGAGTTFTSGTLATTWASIANANRAVGGTNLAAATNNYWQVTGVQLEVGPVASSFEFKSYGQELRECQRYYFRTTPGATNSPLGIGWNASTTGAAVITSFPVPMRIRPTALETSGTANQYQVAHGAGVTTCSAVPVYGISSLEAGGTTFIVASGLTAGQGSGGRTDSTNGATAYLGWSAEL